MRQPRRAPQLRPPRVVTHPMRHSARVLLDSGRALATSSVVNSATCSMTIAAAVHAAAMPPAYRFNLYVMRLTRSACLEHRVATFGLLRSHLRRPSRRAIGPHLVVLHYIQVW